MMVSPFDGTRTSGTAHKPFAGMLPGETRTMIGPKEGIEITLTRTERPFVYDWVDSSNANLPPGSGFIWLVDEKSQQPKLVTRRFVSQSRDVAVPRRMLPKPSREPVDA